MLNRKHNYTENDTYILIFTIIFLKLYNMDIGLKNSNTYMGYALEERFISSRIKP